MSLMAFLYCGEGGEWKDKCGQLESDVEEKRAARYFLFFFLPKSFSV
jgi:hypothetical protein